MDIGLNEDFDVELDDRKDLPMVEGREAFEQALAIRTTAYFHQVIGVADPTNLLRLLKMQAERVADDTTEIEGSVEIEVGFSDTEPNTVEVTAIYDMGDEYTFPVSE